MGVVVVVRAPGQIVRGVQARGLRVVGRGRARTLELALVNRGNVTESFARARAVVSLERGGRRLARVRGEARELRPRTRGVLQFRYRGSVTGRVIAQVDVSSDSGQVVRRAFRIRL
jgi:translation initiation factor IF-1